MKRFFVLGLMVVSLIACASSPSRDAALKKVKELKHSNKEFPVSVAWGKQFANWEIESFTKNTVAADEGSLYYADSDGNLVSVDAKTGSVNWRQKYSLSFTGGPLVSGQWIYLGTTNAFVVVVDKKTGTERWRARVSSEILTPPQPYKNMVVVRTNDGKIAGLTEKDGAPVWVYDKSVPVLSLRGNSSPIVTDDKVIAGFANGKLIALSVYDGKELWQSVIAVATGRSELERMVDIDGDIQYVDDTVYAVSYQGRLAAVSIASGRVVWSRDLSGYSGVKLSADKQVLFLTDASGKIWALNRESGATLWMQDKLADIAVTAPSEYRDYLVVGDMQNNLFWLAKTDGRVIGYVDYKEVLHKSGLRFVVDDLTPPIALDAGFPEKEGVAKAPLVGNDQLYVVYRSGVIASLVAANR